MTDAEVETALLNDFKVAGFGPVAWPGVKFDPPDSGTWYRVSYLPGAVVSEGMGVQAMERLRGVMFVNVFAPKGHGRGAAVSAAMLVMDRYKRGTSIALVSGSMRIVRSYRNTAIEDDRWMQIPVIVEFIADLPR